MQLAADRFLPVDIEVNHVLDNIKLSRKGRKEVGGTCCDAIFSAVNDFKLYDLGLFLLQAATKI